MQVVGDFLCVVTGQTKATDTQARLLLACPGLGTQGILFVPRGRWRRGREGGAAGFRTQGRGPARSPPPPPLAPPPPRGWAPSLPPLPTLRPVAPGARARAYTREPRQHANEVPRGGGPGWGGRGRRVVPVRAPERAPGTCSGLLGSLLRTPTSRPAERSGLARADPLLAAPATNVPAPLIGHRTLRARPACGLGHSRLTGTRRTGLWVGEGRRATLSLHRYVPETQLLAQATSWCKPCDPGNVAPVWTSCCVHIKRGGCKFWGCSTGLVCMRP